MRATTKHGAGAGLLLVVATALVSVAAPARATSTSTSTSTSISVTTTTGARPGRAPTAVSPAATVTITAEADATCAGTIYCFSPGSVTVAVGDTVRWANASGIGHTVTRCTPADCRGFDGGTGTDASFTSLNLDTEVTHMFTAPGTYNYFCMIHGYDVMHGTIVVQGSSATTTAPSTNTTVPPTTAANGPNTATTQPSTTAAAGSSAQLASTGTSPRPLALGVTLLATGLALALVRRPRRTRR